MDTFIADSPGFPCSPVAPAFASDQVISLINVNPSTRIGIEKLP